MKMMALAAAAALAASAAVAHPGHDGSMVEKKICKIKQLGDAEAHEVPCDSVGEGGPDSGEQRVMMRMKGGLEALDANKDGRVSFDEMSAMLREHFSRLDKNKSGYLEKDEMPDHATMMVEEHH